MRRARWLLVAALAVIVFSDGAVPWIAALKGSFWPPDLAKDLVAARSLREGRPIYGDDFGERHAALLGETAVVRPYYPHPPLAPLLTLPLAGLDLATAAGIWFGLQVALVFVLAVQVATALSPPAPSLRSVLPFCAALFLWPPTLYCLEKGQWSILLATMVGAAWLARRRGAWNRAGAWIGAAGAVKLFPIGLSMYLLLRRPRALVAAAAAFAIAQLAPTLVEGPGVWPGFLAHSRGNAKVWECWIGLTLSLHGALARVLIGGRDAIAWVHAPVAAWAIEAAIALALVGIAARLTLGASVGARSDGERDGPVFALWAILVVLLNPMSMGHNVLLLPLPLALVFRELGRERPRSPVATRTAAAIALGVGVLLVSVPKEALYRLAGPTPLPPLRSLGVITLPCYGLLAMFLGTALVVATARDDRPDPATGTAAAGPAPAAAAG